MEDVQHVLEANRVDSAIGVAAEVISNLKNPAPKAFEGLGVGGVIPRAALQKGPGRSPAGVFSVMPAVFSTGC
jgi:hypothetical protein